MTGRGTKGWRRRLRRAGHLCTCWLCSPGDRVRAFRARKERLARREAAAEPAEPT